MVLPIYCSQPHSVPDWRVCYLHGSPFYGLLLKPSECRYLLGFARGSTLAFKIFGLNLEMDTWTSELKKSKKFAKRRWSCTARLTGLINEKAQTQFFPSLHMFNWDRISCEWLRGLGDASTLSILTPISKSGDRVGVSGQAIIKLPLASDQTIHHVYTGSRTT